MAPEISAGYSNDNSLWKKFERLEYERLSGPIIQMTNTHDVTYWNTQKVTINTTIFMVTRVWTIISYLW